MVDVTDFSVVKSDLQQTSGGNVVNNESLYSVLPHTNVQSVDLTNSNIVIRKSFTVNISNNSTGTVMQSNETFLPFDEERYTLVRSDGSFEILTQDKFTFSAGNTQVTINGLGANDTGSTLTTALRKSNIKSLSLKSKK